MAKVLLVEDDNNLREIYEARLQAEGYEISSAQDGEQALVVAKQFKPDLIISDVMMPKISGFEMLDILRNTEGLEHTRVIMLTALGQAEDKTRADSLGADRYLVKSQVTLEDIVKSAHEILDGDGASPAPVGVSSTPPSEAADATPVNVVAAPDMVAAPAEMPVADAELSAPATEPVAVESQPTTQPVVEASSSAAPDSATPDVAEAPAVTDTTTTPEPVAETSAPSPGTSPEPSASNSAVVDNPAPAPVVQPTAGPTESTETAQPDVTPAAPNPEAAAEATSSSEAGTTASEQQTVNQQIEDFINSTPASDDSAQSDASSDDQLLADAADSLSDAAPSIDAGTTDAMTADVVSPEPVTAEQPAPGSASDEPAAPAAAPSQNDAENDGVTIVGKKVIQPLDSSTKPDLSELLAREEAKESGLSPNPVASSTDAYEDVPMPPHQPGQAFAPDQPEDQASGSPQPPKPNDFNPHDIAL